MKAKKTLKRLDKVVALLSDVIGRLPDSKNGLEDLLGSAKANVVRAKKMVHAQPSNGAAKADTSGKTAKEKAPTKRLSAAGRKKISAAAKKRWEAARRKGVNPVTGRPLSKTA
jgi:hypothetical protein